MLFSPRRHTGNVSKRKAYTFATLFSLIVLVLLAVFNLRPDIIEKLIRHLIGN